MKCPRCGHGDNKVVDSRVGKDGDVIRRRRECLSCRVRFTTYERIEEELPLVVKRDGRREPFDRQKILTGILKACEKRPVSYASIERVVDAQKVASARVLSLVVSATRRLTLQVLATSRQ